MHYIFVIRLKQFYRTLHELRVFRSLFLGATILFLYFLHLQHYLLNSSIYIFLFYMFVITSIHVKRGDKEFLQRFFKRSFVVFLMEYLCISLPFFIVTIVTNNWLHTLFLLGYICLLSFLFPSIALNSLGFPTLKYNFHVLEWYAGFRRYALLLVLLNVLSVVVYQNIGIQVVIVLVMAFVFMSFFVHCENKELLEAYADSARVFLKQKAGKHLQYAFIFVLVPFGILAIFHMEYFYLTLVLLVLFIAMQLFAIYLKYTLFEPGEHLTQNGILHTLFFVGFIFPFFVPVALYFLFKYRTEALRNLKRMLHA